MSNKNQNDGNDNKQNQKNAVSVRFANQVEKQFTAEMGSKLQFTDYEKTLAQHLFLRIDQALKEFEDKRISSGQTKKSPYTWDNINMTKLALDAVHRIALGLDALLPNHIHPVPYFNGKLGKYDLDLRIGFEGKDYYRREMAVEKPIKIIYELVHETDTFIPIKQSLKNEIEYYEFEINNPFDRGKAIGGFGYIMYDDPKKNKLIIVTNKDFEESQKYAQSDTFWGKHLDKMKYKTLVHRTTEKLQIDPRKVNAKSYSYVENQDTEEITQREIDENANSEVIDIETEEPESQSEPEPQQESESIPEQKQKSEQQQLKMARTNGSEGPGF
jgi:recombination protein RecT